MGGKPGDHRNAEPVYLIGELVQIRTIDAGIDQDQPTLPAHRDGIAPYPLALPDPDAVGHLIQHRFSLSGVSVLSRSNTRLHRRPAHSYATLTRWWLADRVLLMIVCLLVRRVLGLAVLAFRGNLAKDAELLVLRHQNAVLRRHAGRIR